MSEVLSEIQTLDDLKDQLSTVLKERNDLAMRCEKLAKERDILERRLREVCQSHGTTLIHMHDLEKERDALKAELREAAAIAEEIGPLVYDSLYLQVRNSQEAKEFMLRDPRFQKAARFLEKREAQP